MWWFSLLYPAKRHSLLALLFLIMGFGLDYSQSFISTRVFDFRDVIANGIGIMLGWILAKTPLALALVRIERFLSDS